MKSDFLPYLCRKQFSFHKKHLKDLNSSGNTNYNNTQKITKKPRIFDYLKVEELSDLMYKSTLENADLLSCYAFIQADGFCLRTNNLAIYAEANRQVVFFSEHTFYSTN